MISVIIATHNRADLLDEELQHVYKQRNAEFEVIVINDNEEPEATDLVMKKYPSAIYVKDKKIQGPCNKYKAGFKLAKGSYLYMPNDDDYLTDREFFSKSETILNHDKTISFVSGNVTILHEYVDYKEEQPTKLNVQGRVASIDYIQHFQEDYQKPLSTVSTIFRKEAFDKIGIENIIEFTDSSQYLIALLYGDAHIMEDDVAVYRTYESENNLTYNVSKNFIINVLKQKEKIYFQTKCMLPHARTFWKNQYMVTYSLVDQSRMKILDKAYICLWGILHSHGSRGLIKYIIRNLHKIIFK